jgi:hypothetical protein
VGGEVPEGDVEGEGVDGVLVAFEFVDEVAGLGVPDLAGAVVAAGDEPSWGGGYLSPFLLKEQLVRGSTCALRVLNTVKCWFFFSSSFRISSS